MTNLVHILNSKRGFVFLLIIVAAVLAVLAPKAAVNVDEMLHYPHAKQVVNWYFTSGEDTSCLNTPVTNLKYYGQSVDNLTALINRIFAVDNEFLLRHYTGAFFFLLLLLFTGLTARSLTGSYAAAVLSVLSVCLMPRVFGQAFGNLKDIPFAAGYMAAIFFILQLLKQLPNVKWSTVAGLALAIAFTNSVRIGGLILFGYLGIGLLFYFILKPFLLKHIVTTKSIIVRLVGQAAVIALVGYFGSLVFWPYALQNVISNPLESLSVMEHYKVSIRQIFEGNVFWSTDLPWWYLPKWTLIATPEFIFLGLLLYFVLKFRKGKSKELFYEMFALFTLVFPILYVVLIDSNLYSGLRQMLFVFPVAAIFSSMGIMGIVGLARRMTSKAALVIFVLALMVLPLLHQAKTFPVDYVYFNSISGGNKQAWSNYEYDYYFHALKKPVEELVELANGEQAIVAVNCNLPNYFEKHENLEYHYARYLERSSSDWDYGIFGINYLHPQLLSNGKWFTTQTIKTYFHHGNPVAILVKRTSKSDLEGIRLMNSNNTEEAQSLLRSALDRDPNNIWLLVQLAKISLKNKDFKSFKRYLQTGRAICADYEPFYLLEGQYQFSVGNISEAKKVLDKLMEVNPRYKNAKPLLEAVNNKLLN